MWSCRSSYWIILTFVSGAIKLVRTFAKATAKLIIVMVIFSGEIYNDGHHEYFIGIDTGFASFITECYTYVFSDINKSSKFFTPYD